MFAPQLSAQQLLAHATQLHRNGSYAAAAEVYRQLLRSFPNNPDILDKLGATLAVTGSVEESRKLIERAIALAPGQAMYHHDLHLTYKREGRFDEAVAALEKALKLSPRHPSFSAALAEVHILRRDWDGAMRTLDPVRKQAAEVPSVALMLANIAPRYGLEREGAEALRTLLVRTDLAASNRVRANFALAHLLDYLGDYDGAWFAVVAANAIRGDTWDAEALRAAVDGAIEAWTPEAVAAAPRADIDASSMVLVVGVPRAGSGLIVTTLDSLPGGGNGGMNNDLVAAARDMQGLAAAAPPIFSKPGTLTKAALTERAKAYLERRRAAVPAATLITDRMPMNLLNLGLISRMLPGAKVILCTRDRIDSTAACFLHLFNAGFPFTHNVTKLAQFIHQADRLAAHWKRVLPELPLLEISYEDLLQRPEPTTKRMVSFVGRPWSDDYLDAARRWMTTVTLPDGTLRDIVPDARIGIGKDYAARLEGVREVLAKG